MAVSFVGFKCKSLDDVHVYDVAPATVNCALSPTHTVALVAVNVGVGLTVTLAMAVFLQLLPSVPVTV